MPSKKLLIWQCSLLVCLSCTLALSIQYRVSKVGADDFVDSHRNIVTIPKYWGKLDSDDWNSLARQLTTEGNIKTSQDYTQMALYEDLTNNEALILLASNLESQGLKKEAKKADHLIMRLITQNK